MARRLLLTVCLSGVLVILLVLSAPPFAPLRAQDTPATSTPATPAPVPGDVLATAQALNDDSQTKLERAEQLVDIASNLLGVFESVGVAIGVLTGVVIPFLAIVAGFVGLNRLNSAQEELEKARERFEKQVAEREKELDKLRNDLQSDARSLRDESNQATLALALMPLGERQYKAQDYQGALDTYKRALELDSDNPVTHYRMGYVYVQSGTLDKAEESLKYALSIEKNFAPALAALGYVYRRIGEKMPTGLDRDVMLNLAEQNLLAALKLSPKLIDDDGESWWGSLGGLYRRRGQLDEAIGAYKRASEVTPHSSYPFSNLALLYMQKHNREEMVKMYKRVERLAWGEVQAEVDNYWAYADLVVARLALGKVKEAEDVLDTTISTAPLDSPYMLESLADTLGRLSAALEPADRAPVDRTIVYVRNVVEQRKTLLKPLEG